MGLSNISEKKNEEDSPSSEKISVMKEKTNASINKEDKLTSNGNVQSLTNLSGVEGMMERLFLRCRVCEEKYSDERVPRNLTCGHSLCTECMKQCLADKKQCPDCHETQLAKTVTDQPINYPLLRIIRSITNKEIDLKEILISEIPVHEPVCDIYQDAGQCPVHSSPLVFLCASCSVWVCQDCLVVDHPYLPRGSCRILNLKKAMEQVKMELRRNADLSNTDIEHIDKNFESVKDKHNLCSKFVCCGDRSHSRLLRVIENGLEALKKEDESTVDKVMEQIKELSASAENTTSPEEITVSCKQLLDCLANLKEYISGEEVRRKPVLKNIHDHIKMDLKYSAIRHKTIYAVHEVLGSTRYSRITLRENRLIMYSLKEEVPPKDSILVPYEIVIELISQEYTTVFFEVGTAKETLGRVYVKMRGKHARIKQTRLLCMGEVGPCYRNTCFFAYDDEHGVLKGGDYQHNNGSGGQSILPDVDEYHLYGGNLRKFKGAFLLNEELMGQFAIHLKDTSHLAYSALGFVTYGLECLFDASKTQPVNSIVVQDCGLFIPMPRNDEADDEDDKNDS